MGNGVNSMVNSNRIVRNINYPKYLLRSRNTLIVSVIKKLKVLSGEKYFKMFKFNFQLYIKSDFSYVKN